MYIVPDNLCEIYKLAQSDDILLGLTCKYTYSVLKKYKLDKFSDLYGEHNFGKAVECVYVWKFTGTPELDILKNIRDDSLSIIQILEQYMCPQLFEPIIRLSINHYQVKCIDYMCKFNIANICDAKLVEAAINIGHAKLLARIYECNPYLRTLEYEHYQLAHDIGAIEILELFDADIADDLYPASD